MRFKITSPYDSGDGSQNWYVLAPTPEVEAEVNRLGPVKLVSSALDWPFNEYAYHGWTDSINRLWWPRGADTFSSVVLLVDDARAARVDAAVAAWAAAADTDHPRPYLILQCLLAPAEGYAPAGVDPVSVETELVAWKLYPLSPVRLPVGDNGGAASGAGFGGLSLLPLVDERYFHRLTPVWSVIGGSGRSGASGSGGIDGSADDPDFPVVRLDYDSDPPWMPALGSYPDDSGSPPDYVAISGNGTCRDIAGETNWGVACDTQAETEQWRVVCRDVRSAYVVPGGQPHTDFTGILSDYPDPATFGASLVVGLTLGAGGTGYTVGDELHLAGGTGSVAVVVVTGVDAAGAVAAYVVADPGSYSALPGFPNSPTGGTGAGAAFASATTTTTAASSYHADAIALAAVAGNLVTGGAPNQDTALDTEAQALHCLFPVGGQAAYYGVFLEKGAEDVTRPAQLTNVPGGPSAAQRRVTPKGVLGVKADGTTPDNADDLVRAAQQWGSLYYRWRRKQEFFVYPGIAPVMPNGYGGFIQWSFTATECTTAYNAAEAVSPNSSTAAPGVGNGGDDDDDVKFVQVIGPADVVAGRYPGAVLRQEGLPFQWPPDDPNSLCWLVEANNFPLRVGQNYLARAGDRYAGLKTYATFCCCPCSGDSGSGPAGPGGDSGGAPLRPSNCSVCGDPNPPRSTPFYKVPPLIRVTIRPTTSFEVLALYTDGAGGACYPVEGVTYANQLSLGWWQFDPVNLIVAGGPSYSLGNVIIDYTMGNANGCGPYCSGGGGLGIVDPTHIFYRFDAAVISCTDRSTGRPTNRLGVGGPSYFKFTAGFCGTQYQPAGGNACGSWDITANESWSFTRVISLDPLYCIIYPGTGIPHSPSQVAIEIRGLTRCPQDGSILRTP